MKISYNWLSRYLSQIPDPLETADILTLTGLEVEEIEQTGSDLTGIVVGEVLDVQPHPDADRLVVCSVDIGDKEPSQIVCGAPNVEAGQKVPVATVGSVLPVPLPDGSPFKIRKAKIRGQKSAGMICAEDELGLSDDHSGIMVLDGSVTPGTPFTDVVTTYRDTVYEIGLTPNRPDATCHLGVARDLAAVTGARLQKPLDALPDITGRLEKGTIGITDTDKCHRYTGILICGITVGESPGWMKNLLQSIGLRPINNVVDITNFVLHELGQPLHAFDYRLLSGGRINVRSFDREMKFTTLDEVERTIPAGSLFICDGEKPVALAGVMGGHNSEITAGTTDLLIESAYFEPTGIRKTARNLALQTDSSYRFERGVDPNITKTAALRCAELVRQICGGNINGIADVHPVRTEPLEIELRHERNNLLLGVPIDAGKVVQILERLEFDTFDTIEQKSGKAVAASDRSDHNTSTIWRCTVPTFRPDITSEIDLIEEVARIFDYNNIPDPERITIAQPEPVPFREQFLEKVRSTAVAAGLKEIYTNSLLPEHLYEPLGGKSVVVPTLNPITKDQALLRTSLLYGFLRSAAYNFNRGINGVQFFEIGNIFRKTDDGGTWIEGIHESTHLHIGIAGQAHSDHWKSPARNYDIFDLKALVQSVMQQLGLDQAVEWRLSGDELLLTAREGSKLHPDRFDGQSDRSGNSKPLILGALSPVSPEWNKRTEVEVPSFSSDLQIDLLQNLVQKSESRTYKPVSRFPSFAFDLSLVVNKNVASGDLEKSMYIIGGSQLKTVEVFDVFEGGSLEKNQKSIAFRLTFQDNAKTLTIKDVDPVIKKKKKKLGSEFATELRS